MRANEILIVAIGALLLITFLWWLWRQDRTRRAVTIFLVLSLVVSLFPLAQSRRGEISRAFLFDLSSPERLATGPMVLQYIIAALIGGMVWVFSRPPGKPSGD